MFYFRKRINYKLFRVSLFTKSLKIAITRAKVLNLLKRDELMFTLQKGSYKLIFEYDTHEELVEILKMNNIQNISEEIETFEKTNLLLEHEVKNKNNNLINNIKYIGFRELEILFVAAKKEEAKKTQKKVKDSTYTKYAQTFSDLKIFFKDKDINKISKEDFEKFRDSFIKKGRKNTTTNEKMMYLNIFLKFALEEKLIRENKATNIKTLFVEEVKKELFINEDLKNIFNSKKIKDEDKKIFKVMLYSGMRIMEIYNLTKQNLKTNEDDIKYISLEVTKFDKKRDIPIHKEIEDILYNLNFENLRKTWKQTRFANYFNEQIFKVIPKTERKTNHTFRANFVNKLINKFPDQVQVIQEIIGHESDAKTNLTIKKYGKGFDLEVKKKLIDALDFDI